MRKVLIAVIALCVLGAIFFTGCAFMLQVPTKETVHSFTPITTPKAKPYTGPVAMTVASTETMKWAPQLEPKDFVHVYQLVDESYGFYATGGTTYLLTHSYAVGHGAPGNTWEKLVVGNVVKYNGYFYQVNRVSTPAKGEISKEPVWTNDPNMLVMITCVSRGPGNPATNNYVIRLVRIG